MIKVSIADIQKKKFSKSILGLNASEVESFLRDILETYESFLTENASLKESLLKTESQLEDLRKLLKENEEFKKRLLLVEKQLDEQRDLSDILLETIHSFNSMMARMKKKK